MITNPFTQLGIGQAANTTFTPVWHQATQVGNNQNWNLFQQAQQAQQAYNPQHMSAIQAQQAAAFNQYAQQEIERKDWMIDGKRMTFKEFADTLFPEDTAERTMFFLKYSK
jgi:hypothetical protein